MKAYLKQLTGARTAFLLELEQFAVENNVPIMERDGIETMLHFMKVVKAKNVLEIGTAIGYSALSIVEGLPEQVSVVTVERDEKMFDTACENIKKANQTDAITTIFGDALDSEAVIAQCAPFDCIFIDAAKGQYQKFFELYAPYLSEGGIIFTDNVLFKGLVAAADSSMSKRATGLVNKLRHYNQWLMAHPDFDTIILNSGDGLAVSIKRGKKSSYNDR